MPAKLSLIRNARVMPFQGTMDHFAAGVYDGDGRFLDSSIIRHRASPSEYLPVTKTLSGTYIFGGYLFYHFGHFLLESLSRVYAIRQCRLYPVVFTSPNEHVGEAQKKLFRFLRIENEILLLREPTAIENLIMSEAGSSIHPPLLLEEQVRALGVFRAGAPQESGNKIWLSRSKVRGGGLENEADIEKELRRMDWTIVHPEELSYREQARCVSTARRVAGLDGSAFYSALLADTVHGDFSVFSRRAHIPPILNLALARKTDRVRTFLPPVEPFSGMGTEARVIVRDPETILGPLREDDAAHGKPLPPKSVP